MKSPLSSTFYESLMNPLGNFLGKSQSCEEREEPLRRQGLQGHALPRQLRLTTHRVPLGAHVACQGTQGAGPWADVTPQGPKIGPENGRKWEKIYQTLSNCAVWGELHLLFIRESVGSCRVQERPRWLIIDADYDDYAPPFEQKAFILSLALNFDTNMNILCQCLRKKVLTLEFWSDQKIGHRSFKTPKPQDFTACSFSRVFGWKQYSES